MSGIMDWTLTISDGVQDIEYEVLAKVEDNDYEWSAEAVLRRTTDGALFFATDSGCSCYGFGDGITSADLRPIEKVEDAYRLVDADDREKLQRSYETQAEVWR